MVGPISIETPDSNSLLLRKSRAAGIRSLLGPLLFYAAWYAVLGDVVLQLWPLGLPFGALAHVEGWVALFQHLSGIGARQLLFVILPLTALPQILAAARISIWGWSLLLDGNARVILQGGRRKALFGDVRAVKVATTSTEGVDDYLVSILLTDGRALHITQSRDRELTAKLAADTARLLTCQVVKH
jgi:hypothetical protein